MSSHLNIISIDNNEKWDNIVKSFKNYDVNYLSGYARAFQMHGEGEPLLIYYDDGSNRAINVVMKRDIAKAPQFTGKLPINTWYDFSTPYGYGGFWIEGEGFKALNDEYSIFCQEQGIVSEFVRFHLLSNYRPHYIGTYETHTHNVIRTLELSHDEMLRDFDHKVRKNIKRALNNGLVVEVDDTGNKLEEFFDIYYTTMDRNNASENFHFIKQFFETINHMKDNFVYFHVLSEGKVISSELVLYGSENCYSFLGGTNSDYFNLRPNDFLKHEIIKWAKEKGLKRFILGGGYGEDDGIYKYKKSFAPNGVCDFYIGKMIFDKNKYINLLKLRNENSEFSLKDYNIDCMSGFFPKYRESTY